MGILDSLLGAVPQDPNGPIQSYGARNPDSLGMRLASMLAPDLYKSRMEQRAQAAAELGLSDTSNTNNMAHAMALNPQLLQQAGGAYLPSAPQVHTITNPLDGSTQIFQSKTQPGGNASFSPLPVTPLGAPPAAAPAAPPAAAPAAAPEPFSILGKTPFPAPPPPPDISPMSLRPTPVHPGAYPPTPVGVPGSHIGQPGPAPTPVLPAPPGATIGTAPASNVVGSSNTIAGGTGQLAAQLNAARAAGATQDQLINMLPDQYKEPMRAVIEGREMPTAFSQRAQDRANLLLLAPAVSPGFDMGAMDARNAFKKSYDNPSGNTLGNKMTSLERVLGHMDETGAAFLPMNNSTGFVGPLAHANNDITNWASSRGGMIANVNRSTKNYSAELNSYLSNNKGDVGGRESLAGDLNQNSTPLEAAGTLESDLNFVQKQLAGMEQQRDKVFQSDPQLAQKYEISSAHARALMASIQQKIDALKAQGAKSGPLVEGIKSLFGSGSAPAAAAPEVRVDAQGNRWTRDAGGNVVPAGNPVAGHPGWSVR